MRIKTQESGARFDALQKFVWGIFVASLPFQALNFWAAKLKSFGEPAVFLAVLLGILVLGQAVLQWGRIFVPRGRSSALLAGFLVILALSCFVSYHINPYMWVGHSPWTKSVKQLAQWMTDALVVYLTLRFVRTWRDFRFALICAFVGFLACAGAALIEIASHRGASQSILGSIFLYLHSGGGYQEGSRLNLLATEPSVAGDYLLSILPFLICGSFYWKSRVWIVAWSGVALILFCGTFSLGSFGALFVAALVVGIVYARRGSKGLIAGALLLVAILVAVTVRSSRGEEFVGGRIDEIFQSGLDPGRISSFSTRQRLANAEAAFNMFLDHPLTGVGVGKSPFYMRPSYPVWALKQRDVEQSTFEQDNSIESAISINLMIQTLAETGLVGTTVFVALLFSMLADCYVAMNAVKEPWRRRAFAGILFALVAQIVHYNALSQLGFRYWFFIWGLAIGAPHLAAQRDVVMLARKSTPLYRWLDRGRCGDSLRSTWSHRPLRRSTADDSEVDTSSHPGFS